jgi:hypothetical protein
LARWWLAIEQNWLVRLLIAVGGLSLLARLRHARGRQRQQVKWLTYVGVLLAATLVVQLNWHPMGLALAVYLAAVQWAIYLAIGIAILRHRLYDIDRLINRTLVYGLLTAILGLVYAGGVFVVGQLLNPAGGESGLAVAASTLMVAALFRPCGDGCRPRSTGASTAAAITRPRRSRGSAPAYARNRIWTPSPPSCWLLLTRPWSRPGSRSGFDPPHPAPRAQLAVRHGQLPGPTELESRSSGLCQPGCSSVRTPQRRTTSHGPTSTGGSL